MATAFWIAHGNKYRKEARVSAASVKRQMPDLKRILFADVISDWAEFDKAVKLPDRHHKWWYRDAVEFMRFAIMNIDDEKMLYLDTDTYMCEPIHDVLEVLDKYNVAAVHAPGRITCGYDKVPPAFPEINVGVCGFSRIGYGDKIRYLCDEWMQTYNKNPEVYKNNDQGVLRDILWRNPQIRLYILPPEYCLRWGFGGYARYRVKVLHGRTNDYEAIRNKINFANDMRGWRRGEI